VLGSAQIEGDTIPACNAFTFNALASALLPAAAFFTAFPLSYFASMLTATTVLLHYFSYYYMALLMMKVVGK
jgi:hypothetical protein